MPKTPLNRPDLHSTNAEIAEAIAKDGTHFGKHGGKDFGLKTEDEYAKFIKDVLDSPETFGFAARVHPKYLNNGTGKIPEFSLQMFYNAAKKVIVITHLKSIGTIGQLGVGGTAYPAEKGRQTYNKKLASIARDGNHPKIEIEKESNYFEALAKRQQGGRQVLVAKMLSRLAPNLINRKISALLPFGIGAAVAYGISRLLGSTPAEARQAAADATPGLRIVAAPNSHERALRAFGAVTLGLGEEGFRISNDIGKQFGYGDGLIDDGLVTSSVKLMGAGARAGYNLLKPQAQISPEGDNGEPSARVVQSASGATRSAPLTARRSTQPLNAQVVVVNGTPGDTSKPASILPASQGGTRRASAVPKMRE